MNMIHPTIPLQIPGRSKIWLTGLLFLIISNITFAKIINNIPDKDIHDDSTFSDAGNISSQLFENPEPLDVPFSFYNDQVVDPNSKVVKSQQNRWIKSAMRKMKGYTPDQCLQHIEFDVIEIQDFYQKTYRLVGNEGCLIFPGGDWIYLITHSEHGDEKIGDISLAMNKDGQFYINEGHVCGDVVHFVIDKKIEIRTSEDFFRYSKNDTDEIPWKLLK